MAIKIFFHICAITRAIDIVKNQIRCIHYSGLYDDASCIYCYISGNTDIIAGITDLINKSGRKFVIIKCVPNDRSYERLTLEDIHNHIDPTDKILYIHSKGVSYVCVESRHMIDCIDDWTASMMYFLVRHYKKCTELLDQYDTVGINLYEAKNCHWSGNFWWVRGDYFLTLPHKIGPEYCDPEVNFLFLNNPKFFEIHHMHGINSYHMRYEPFKYIDAILD